MLSSDVCVSPNTATSNSITMTVLPSTIPSVSASGTTNLCAGQSSSFTASIIGGGSNPQLQWYLNGSAIVGATNTTLPFPNPLNNDSISVVLINNDACAIPNFDMYSFTLTVNPLPDTSVNVNFGILSAVVGGINYQWINCTTGTQVAGATSQLFTPTVAGSYAVIVSNFSTGCSDTSSCYTITNVGIHESDFGTGLISLSSNPTNGEVTISVPTEIQNVQITDLTGRVVFENRNEISGAHTMKTDLSNLPAGMYMVIVKTNNQSFTTRLIKK